MSEEFFSKLLPPGTEIAGYSIIRHLSSGSFGMVYEAHRVGDPNDRVAIKEFLPEQLAHRSEDQTISVTSIEAQEIFDTAKKKFISEAAILLELGSANESTSIVKVSGFDERNNTAYMIMEYLPGSSLRDLMKDPDVTITAESCVDMLKILLGGLKQAHNRKIWHRDIKPDNIMLRNDGTPVLIDFGAARQDIDGLPVTEHAFLTPLYAAPEQSPHISGVSDPVGPYTDIYSLAATFYHALTNEEPQRASLRGQEDKQPSLSGSLTVHEDIVPFLESIDKGLAFEPSRRHQSTDEWLAYLEGRNEELAETRISTAAPNKHQPAADSQQTSVARGLGSDAPLVDPPDQHQSVWPRAAFALITLAVVAAGYVAFKPQSDQPEINNIASDDTSTGSVVDTDPDVANNNSEPTDTKTLASADTTPAPSDTDETTDAVVQTPTDGDANDDNPPDQMASEKTEQSLVDQDSPLDDTDANGALSDSQLTPIAPLDSEPTNSEATASPDTDVTANVAIPASTDTNANADSSSADLKTSETPEQAEQPSDDDIGSTTDDTDATGTPSDSQLVPAPAAQDFASAISQINCGTVLQAEDSNYYGFVDSTETLENLKLAAKNNNISIGEIDVIDKRLCPTLNSIASAGLTITPVGPNASIALNSSDQNYLDGDAIQFDLTNIAPGPRYMYLDYIDSDANTVVHITPGIEAVTMANPGETVKYGEEEGSYSASEPFGMNILLLTLSPVDLYSGIDQPPSQRTVDEYVTFIKKISDSATEDTSTRFITFSTEPAQ